MSGLKLEVEFQAPTLQQKADFHKFMSEKHIVAVTLHASDGAKFNIETKHREQRKAVRHGDGPSVPVGGKPQ